MLSEGEQAGFEATILRADGTKFNEYNVKHTVNEEGCKVTECYLECEDDAGSLPDQDRKDCQGNEEVVTRTDVDDSEETGPSSAVGTISLTLTPGLLKWYGQPCVLQRASLALESTRKLARVTKSTHEEVIDNTEGRMYHLSRHHPGDWQRFVFHYRHRVELEVMGVIDAPLPPPPRHATSRKQTKAGKGSNDQDQKPEVKPDVGSRTPQAPRIFTVLDDSDESDEDESPEEEAARMEAIRKHKEAIELLEKAGHDKGKGKGKRKKRVDMEEDEHVVTVEGSRTRIKLGKDREVVHLVDSD